MNYTILFVLVLFDLSVITAHILLLKKEIILLNNKICQENIEDKKINNNFRRKHSSINPVSFDNPIQTRKNLYDDYKNEKGLYEPITPKKGIVIKEDK